MATKPTHRGDKPTDELSQRQMEKYLSRISGPLIDRIDIHVEVPAVAYHELTGKANGTPSSEMRRRVIAARKRQQARTGNTTKLNSTLSGRELDKVGPLDAASRELLKQAMTELGLSARAYDKIRRIARTIADLEDAPAVQTNHVAEAVQYRVLDRRL